ncbi:MAG: HAD family hydrolase, partial [Akkermansia sp.]
TLGGTLPLCVESFRACVQEQTGQRPSEEEVVRHFGISDRGVLAALLGMQPDDPALPIRRLVQIYEQLHRVLAPAPFPGAVELLRTLRAEGYRLALVTGKEHYTAVPTLRVFGMEGLFDDTAYGVPTRNCKAEQLAALRQRSGVDARALIYVGDAPSDIEMAHRAGIRIINAAWAATAADMAAACTALRPDYRLTDFSELLPLIHSL